MAAWTAFWFETNSAWGLVDSPDAWVVMRGNWARGNPGVPNEAIYEQNLSWDRAAPHPDDVPNFGRRTEHLTGKTTLGEFFDAHGMDRSVGTPKEDPSE